jgi:Xaa-Pro aminopeptidase
MRRKKVDKILEEKGLEGMIFFNTSSIFYLTGSSLIQTERPMVYIYRAAGESALLVPRLELEHASAHVKNCKIYCYPEYPGERHPMEFLKDIVKEEDIAFLSESAYADACRPGNPRETSVEEIAALYKSLL